MSKINCPFRDELINKQFGPAIHATFGSIVDENDQKMINNKKLSHKNLICPADFYEICRKTAWYIYDNSTDILAHSKKDQEYLGSCSQAEFDRQYNPNDSTPFYNELKKEFIVAMNDVLTIKGADELDKQMANNPDLKLADVLSKDDFYKICRKAGFYIFDNISIFEHPDSTKIK